MTSFLGGCQVHLHHVGQHRPRPVRIGFAQKLCTFQEWPLTLAAYNAGEDRIQNVIARTGLRRFEEMARRRLLPDETIHYVPAVLNLIGPNLAQRERR